MERATRTIAKQPDWFPDGFVKLDGAPEIEFQGYQYFSIPTDHSDFTETGVIGNPFTATAEKGEEALRRYGDHLASALEELQRAPVEVHTRNWPDRAGSRGPQPREGSAGR